MLSGSLAPASAAPAKPPQPYLGKVVDGNSWKPDGAPGRQLGSVKPHAAVVDASRTELALRSGRPDDKAPRTRGSKPEAEAVVSGDWQPLGKGELAVAAATPAVDGAQPADMGVTVDVLDAEQAKKYGGRGLTLRLHRTDKGKDAQPVAVKVPDSVLAGLYGADYAGRVRWVQYADEGAAPAPATAELVASARSGTDQVVSPLLASSSTIMLAAASSGASTSGTGDFGATSLSPSAEWDVSAQTGTFSWTYPLRVPPAAAGPAPSLALEYDSQSVDGKTGSTNNQPSAVGEGWDLSGGGFVERSYVPCSVDDGPSGPVTTSGDQCWKTDNATISMGGHSGRLIKDAASGVWKLQSDDGSRVERLTGAGNGTQGGEYWRLTTTDGTQYYFGLNQLPGWAAGKPTTQSAWTAPVFGNDAGEPCHGSTFAASACAQGWRWNLDYVVDPHGNATTYYYAPETNKYAQNGSGATTYVRGGQLEHIEYGLTAGTVYAANAASDKVLFGYADRCVSSTGCDSSNPTNWPDVPWDQNCTGTTCSQRSPSFWTTKRLSTVTTQYLSGTSYATVDTWTLKHSYPDPGDGTSAALWLASIGHKGTSGSSSLSLPDVTFSGVTMQNRVWAIDGLAPLDKYRISSITTESGAVLSVNYSAQDCTPAEATAIMANASTNTRRCFPQWWAPRTTPPQPAKQDLFHKYVVTSVLNDPRTGGTNDAVQETNYVYTGKPAWRYDTSPLVQGKQRTWAVYAGYSSVEVRVGDHNNPAGQQTTAYTFFQGMDGDRASTSGGTKAVSVSASDGSTVPDSLWLAGRVRESRVLNGVGGAVVTSTIGSAWASGITANDGVNTARIVADGNVATIEPLSTGGTRRTETRTTYDTFGRPVQVEAVSPDAGTTCTKTIYATNTTAWLLDFPAETRVVGKPCSVTPTYPADSISAERTIYDGGTFGSAPTRGNATSTQVAKGYTGSTAASAEWLTTATVSYDALGRVTSTTDVRAGLDRTTTTAYTPANGGPVAKTVVTNPLGWATATSFDPAWGVATAVVDQNGRTTTATYDALGRRTAVWAPGRPQATNPTPSIAFGYSVSRDAPIAVSTTRLTPIGTVTGWSLYDGLGRLRQTQTSAPGGGTAVTDTYYDAAGRDFQKNQTYYTTSVQPSGTLFVPTTTISGQQLFTYDGAGRVLTDQQWVNGAKAWQTSNTYLGADRVDTTPPGGGTPTTTYRDSIGNATRLIDYLAATPSGSAEQKAITYRYDPAGRMTGMTDAAGNAWSWTFDLMGRQTSASDPDAGTTTTAYDDAGRAVSTTDARGTTMVSSYDALDRRTALNEATAAGPLLAAWTYDTLSKGQISKSSSYVGSTAGTPGLAYTQAVTGYDAAGRPTGNATTLPAGTPMAGTYTNAFSYAQDGSIQQVSRPAMGGIAAETLKYSYDGLGNVSGFTGTISGSTFTYAGGIAYTYLGRVAQYAQSRAGQYFYRTFTYADGTNRLTRLSGIASSHANTVTSDRKFSYDNSGNVTGVSTTADGLSPDNQCFAYDALRNLTEAWTPTSGNCSTAPSASALGGPAPYWTSYGIDPATRNRTSVVRHSTTGGADTTETYAYPAAGQPHPHAVQSVTRTSGTATTTDTYGWDAAGRTTSRPGQALGYDARGKLEAVTIAADGEKQTSVYDAEGNLLVQSDPVTGTTAFLGDTQLRVAPGATTASASRTYAFNGVSVAERNTTAGVAGSTLYFLDTDPLGTATVEVRATDGRITRRYQDPFGVTRGAAVTWSSARGYLNAPTSSFSGLTQLGARAYDPVLGRFLTVDPMLDLSDPGSLSAYAYASNSPVTYSDPSGLCITAGDDGKCWARKGNTWAPIGSKKSSAPPAAGSGSFYMGKEPRSARQIYMDGASGAAHTYFCGAPNCRLPSATPEEWRRVAAERLAATHCGHADFLCEIIGINAGIDCATKPNWGDCLETGATVASGGIGKILAKAGRGIAKIGGSIFRRGSPADEVGAGLAGGAVARAPSVIRVGELKLPGVPSGATGVPVKTGKGLEYQIPRGTPELDQRVTGIRIMDPVTTGKYQYPNGYAVYMNEAGQRVNPLTGEMIHDMSDPFAHIELP